MIPGHNSDGKVSIKRKQKSKVTSKVKHTQAISKGKTDTLDSMETKG